MPSNFHYDCRGEQVKISLQIAHMALFYRLPPVYRLGLTWLCAPGGLGAVYYSALLANTNHPGFALTLTEDPTTT